MPVRNFQRQIALVIHAGMIDPKMSAAQLEKSAATARRIADVFKRNDPSFCYEWFFGACGLDPWGDVVGATC